MSQPVRMYSASSEHDFKRDLRKVTYNAALRLREYIRHRRRMAGPGGTGESHIASARTVEVVPENFGGCTSCHCQLWSDPPTFHNPDTDEPLCADCWAEYLDEHYSGWRTDIGDLSDQQMDDQGGRVR